MARGTGISRQEEALARRAQILDEAIRLIGRLGYRGFTLQQLARGCGLTNGGVLYHFPSKEAVLDGVLAELERRVTAGIQDHLARTVGLTGHAPPGRAVVLEVLRALVVLHRDDPELTRASIMLEVAAVIDTDHPAHDRIRQSNRSVIDRFSALFTTVCDDPTVMARQTIAMMNGLFWLWLDGGEFDLLGEWDKAIDKILPDKDIAEGET